MTVSGKTCLISDFTISRISIINIPAIKTPQLLMTATYSAFIKDTAIYNLPVT